MHRALGVHNFAGGFTRGMRDAGVQVLGSLESSAFGVETQRANNPGVHVVERSDHWADYLAWGSPHQFRPAVVYGNPACACWSGLGPLTRRGLDWRDNPDFEQTIQLVAVGDALRPRAWVTESVPQAETTGFAAELARFWLDRQYAVTLLRLDAKYLGVSQQRRRVFVVAHRDVLAPRFPEPSMTPCGLHLEAGDGRAEFPLPRGIDEVLRLTPPGGVLRKTTMRHYNTRLVAGYPIRFGDRRVPWDGITGTIAGMDRLYHPFDDRLLTSAEVAVIAGYPADYRFVGAKDQQALMAQAAKAVMPAVGEWLGRQLVASLDAGADPHAATCHRVTHWSRSPRIDNWELVHDREVWLEPGAADSAWLERRVAMTREALGLV